MLCIKIISFKRKKKSYFIPHIYIVMLSSLTFHTCLFVVDQGLIHSNQSYKRHLLNILIGPEKLCFKQLCSRYQSTSTVLIHPSAAATVAARIKNESAAKVPLTFFTSREKNNMQEVKKRIGSERTAAARKKGSLALHFLCLCLAFCLLNTLDILRRRSKAQERDVGCMWVSRYNVGQSKALQREYAVWRRICLRHRPMFWSMCSSLTRE